MTLVTVYQWAYTREVEFICQACDREVRVNETWAAEPEELCDACHFARIAALEPHAD